jgi:hypothetical protein
VQTLKTLKSVNKIMQIGLLPKTVIVVSIIMVASYFGANQLGLTQNLITINSNSSALINFSVGSISGILEASVGFIASLITIFSYLYGWRERRRWRNVVIKTKNFWFHRKS